MVRLIINGKVVTAEDGEMLLSVIRRHGIEVPTLCEHQAVEPSGACRLCTVEITKDSWDGWKGYVTSCLYPVEADLIVSTHCEKVINIRRTLIDLLLARCPGSDVLQAMAEEYGITHTNYEVVPDGDNCIMCGLCTRVCAALGFSAISTTLRGHDKVIAPPLNQPPPDCVGCLSCAKVCPTGVIKFTDEGLRRQIWDRQFEMIECKSCGAPVITREFAAALTETRGIPENYFELCEDCHRKETATTMAEIVSWSRTEEKS